MDDAAAQEETTRCRYKVPEQTFRTMPEGDLVRCLDAMAHTGGGPHHEVADYRNELTRRETERLNKRLLWLTWAIFLLTVVLVASELRWIDWLRAGAGH
jgi:hypothetical protein